MCEWSFMIIYSEIYHENMKRFTNPAVKIADKTNVEECIFGYMASHIECRFNKNSLL